MSQEESENYVSEAIYNMLVHGGNKKIVTIGHSIGIILPRHLFKMYNWKKTDLLKMKIIKEKIVILYNPNIDERIKQYEKLEEMI